MSGQDDMPYFKKMIDEITEEDDRLIVIGKIISNNSDLGYVISDDTGEIQVTITENNRPLSIFKKGSVIKVLGAYNKSTNNLSVDFLEELADFNFDMYKKVYKLKKSINS